MPDGSLSEWRNISCGTPQGTLLGPVAFLVVINDAAKNTEHRLKYVDDLTIPIPDMSNRPHRQYVTRSSKWCA